MCPDLYRSWCCSGGRRGPGELHHCFEHHAIPLQQQTLSQEYQRWQRTMHCYSCMIGDEVGHSPNGDLLYESCINPAIHQSNLADLPSTTGVHTSIPPCGVLQGWQAQGFHSGVCCPLITAPTASGYWPTFFHKHLFICLLLCLFPMTSFGWILLHDLNLAVFGAWLSSPLGPVETNKILFFCPRTALVSLYRCLLVPMSTRQQSQKRLCAA